MDVLAEHHRCTCEKWKEELTRHSQYILTYLNFLEGVFSVKVSSSF